jgi:hypothetical protein
MHQTRIEWAKSEPTVEKNHRLAPRFKPRIKARQPKTRLRRNAQNRENRDGRREGKRNFLWVEN